MAVKLEGAGTKKLELQIKQDNVTLWPHMNDDDLPDPVELKRNSEQGRTRRDYHRGIHINLWLSPAENRRVDRLQRRDGLTFHAWFRRALDRYEQSRPSEAKDYQRKIIPDQVAIVAERELIQSAETLMAVANRQSDWETKKNLRADAGVIMDVAAYFTEIRKEYELLNAKTE